MKIITVFERFEDRDGQGFAEIVFGDDGSVSLTVLTSGEKAADLERALGELRSRGALPVMAESVRTVNDRETLVMYETTLAADQPGYAWAVKDALQNEWGLWCQLRDE